jgi:hypothetical protein
MTKRIVVFFFDVHFPCAAISRGGFIDVLKVLAYIKPYVFL